MNIIYIGPFRFPIFDAAAARVLNICRTLHAIGHNVSVISWGGQYLPDDKGESNEYLHDGIKYTITGELDGKGNILHQFIQKRKRGKKTKRILESLSVKPDVIIMYNARYGLTKMLLSFCEKHKIKLVHDITEWYDKSDMHVDDYIPNYLNMHFLQKKVKNKICISSFLSDYYQDSHNILIPATCDSCESKWNNIDNKIIETFPKFSGVSLIYAGVPKRKDLVHNVINAVNRINKEDKPIRFIIVGISKEDYIKRYADLLDDNILSENIVFIGRVSQELIPTYYQLADFMVLLREPNRKCTAGFPTKFAESFISGTPVIANLTSDLHNYLKNGYTGFVAKGYDTNAIYETLIKNVCSIEQSSLAQMKNNTKKESSKFDYRNYIDELRKYLDTLN